jgi:hypothetical protein
MFRRIHTPEKTKAIVAMWNKGASASVVGEEFGLSRNAVIGIVHRERVRQKKDANIRVGTPPGVRTSESVGGPGRGRGRPVLAHKPTIPQMPSKPVIKHAALRKLPERLTMKREAKPDPRKIPKRTGLHTWVHFDDIGVGRCRYPIEEGGRGLAYIRFCNDVVDGKGSWCKDHRDVVFQPYVRREKVSYSFSGG